MSPGPFLSLQLRTPEALLQAWSGNARTSRWRGLLGDGHELSIARGPGTDLMFSYGDRARFRLDPSASRLECAPREPGPGWERALLSRILPNVRLAQGCEALHASAVASPHGILAIAGPSGTGKTTLALELVRRGMALVSDDVLVLSSDDAEVLGHPGTPHMNVELSAPVPVVHRELAQLGGERWIEVFDNATAAQRVGAVCILERAAHLRLSVDLLPATPLSVAPYMLGLPDGDAERERRRFELYGKLMAACSIVRATGGLEDRVEDLADALEQALDSRCVAMQGAS
jgi:hypothetical protein